MSSHINEVLDKIPVQVRHLSFKPGDVLQISLGGDIGDGIPPWIPSHEEVESTRNYWQSLVPHYVRVAVTHHMEVPTIISNEEFSGV